MPIGGVVVLVDDVEEGALGCGGAADVAEADEEDFDGVVGGGGVLVHVGCVCLGGVIGLIGRLMGLIWGGFYLGGL